MAPTHATLRCRPAPKTDLELLAEADQDPDVILKVAQEVRWREGNVADLEDLALDARPANPTTAGQQGGTSSQPAASRGAPAGSSCRQRSPSPKRRRGAEVGRRAPAARVQELVMAEAEVGWLPGRTLLSSNLHAVAVYGRIHICMLLHLGRS